MRINVLHRVISRIGNSSNGASKTPRGTGGLSAMPMTGKLVRTCLVAGGVGAVLIAGSALAGFVTSTVGTGSAVNPTGTPSIDMVFLPGDSTAPTFADTMTALNSCLSTNQTCAAYQKTAALDADNDGVLSASEILAALSSMSCLSGVPTAAQYARAVIAEVSQLSDLSNCATVQTAITTASGYAVSSPVITDPASIDFAQFGTATSQVSITDGNGNAQSSSNFNVAYSLTVTGPDGNAVTNNWFEFSSSGLLQLASGTDIAAIPPGAYSFDVTVTDNNANSYGLTDNSQFTLNINNQQGCVVNDSISATDFSVASSVSGARVTIGSNHNPNDDLFVRTATTVTTTANGDVTYANFGYSGVTATYDVSTGELEFSGNVSVADWTSIFRLVGYDYGSGTPSTASRTLIYSLSDNVAFNHADGGAHFYTYVASDDIHFQTARSTASGMSLFGMQGYLATITSANEQNYINPKLDGVGWIGGCDRLGDSTIQSRCGISSNDLSNLMGKTQSQWTTTTGHWATGDGESYFYWVTGPERLEFIGEDTLNCNASNYAQRKQETLPISGDSTQTNPASSIVTTGSNYPYHNFQGCEPNNYRHDSGGENYMHVYGNGAWNDYRHDDGSISGYLVEFGGPLSSIWAQDNGNLVDIAEISNYDITNNGAFCAHQ